MKRIFCDCCGKEFQYDSILSAVNGRQIEVVLTSPLPSRRQIKVGIRIPFEIVASNGHHIDLCADCRWKAVSELDLRPKGITQPSDLDRDFHDTSGPGGRG